ncbi:ABC transporter substrate-binding protein [Streptacidiphilus rugosus]|uniref:ABC transporter substrate-binding protein n=1 Tax=Streptacidiphilus rugosus TaxID=405783 RepID=UPI0018DDFE6A|nr:ABC transporter substrate-binding protein [Streptacidiphilus rugosus]
MARRGGSLRVGVTGGSTADTLDAHTPVDNPDIARVIQLYDTLAVFNADFAVESALAEFIEPTVDAAGWTIRLKPGLVFHNGKPVTAADVVYTFQRLLDPATHASAAPQLSAIDLNNIRVLDSLTLQLNLKRPDVTLPQTLALYHTGIVPVGYDPRHPVGTGPFKYSSFTPGKQSAFVRNDRYWRPGEPYVNQVTIIDYPDDAARVNALLAGQVDAIDELPLGQVDAVAHRADLRVLESQTGDWLTFTMRVDVPPFDDERVRQAFRLVVDREQMVREVLGGHGVIANDLYARYDPAYLSTAPQRHQDIAQAKALLKQAGHENLTVELVTAPVATGLMESARLFAQQAATAGITVHVRQVTPGVFFGDNYLKWPFAQDDWFTRNYILQAYDGTLPESPFNETHWNDPTFTRLVAQARATVDQSARTNLLHQAQQIEYDRGGYIIWGFTNQIGAYTAKVNGFIPSRSGLPLSQFELRRAWFTA